jgi:hypothetical protein
LLSLEESGVCQDLQVMADRRLTELQRRCEVANACFAAVSRRDEAEKTETGRIGYHSECCRHLFGLCPAERSRKDLGAALLGDDLDELHGDILTTVDAYVNVSTLVDAPRGGVRASPLGS